MIYLIADTHFGDDAVRRYENRPFDSVQEMNRVLTENWNRTVSETDTVYVLGDFAIPGMEKETVGKLNGRKLLVKGNHDILTNQEYRDMGFAEVYDLPVILDSFWILSHEPLYINENMPYANIFGHVHASPQYRTFSRQHYCVSVERLDYQPVSLDIVKETVRRLAGEKTE